jgi:(1->4)-alpha-D-glucan 1-alpha-D-glucosylmutase
MTERAAHARPDLAEAIATLTRLLADVAPATAAGRDLVVRFQQVCGPVMAKGVEDTTFYRWHRMIALDEVGDDPRSLDEADQGRLHAWARGQAERFPRGLTTLSTHDTKRSEDVRARLIAVAEDIEGWDAVWALVRARADERGVDEPTAYLLFQTVLGAWPLELDRLTEYMRKAAREAKQHTSWNDVDEAYEARLAELGAACIEGEVAHVVARVLAADAEAVRATTLAGKLLQLTLPGVPDVYQGDETVEPSLVDPDNRRPVDFELRAALLDAVAEEAPDLAAEKLLVTHRTLVLRRERPELFGPGASYEPLASGSPHALGFVRAGAVATVVTRWPGLLARTGWGQAAVALPARRWRDVLTGAVHEAADGTVPCSQLLRERPVALLVAGA